MTTKVVVPPLGQTVDTVTLVAWHKREGDAVTQGEMLFAIETDKATLDVESPASGVLSAVTARPGETVPVLSTIALIAAPGEAAMPAHASVPEPNRPLAVAPPGAPGAAAPGDAGRRERLFVSPRARRLAERHGVPLAELRATGPQGAIVERDVRAFLDAPHPQPLAARSESGRPGDGARSAVEQERPATPGAGAGAMWPATLNAEADATRLAALRQQLAEGGIRAAYHDLLIAILVRVLRDQPWLNASLQNGGPRERPIDVGLLAATERGMQLLVIRDVAFTGLSQLAAETQSLIDQARAGGPLPDDGRGPAFVLADLGGFGIDSFTPVVPLPGCPVLGMGRVRQQQAGGHTLWLSLSFDVGRLDAASGARFLQRVVQLVERPHLLLG